MKERAGDQHPLLEALRESFDFLFGLVRETNFFDHFSRRRGWEQMNFTEQIDVIKSREVFVQGLLVGDITNLPVNRLGLAAGVETHHFDSP